MQKLLIGLGTCLLMACGGGDGPTATAAQRTVPDAGNDSGSRRVPDASLDAGEAPPQALGLTFRGDIQPITQASQAKPGTFIPPHRSCVDPIDGVPGQGPDGKVCTNVMISGATEAGRRFVDYASCDIVMTQRPFWSQAPAGTTDPNDPRLSDTDYLNELGWVKQQIEATGCVCCHDGSNLNGRQAGEWDIQLGPLWLDSLSNSGLALFAGLADSSSLGAYAPEDNNGFERDLTGVPSTDGPRMQAFMLKEMQRRGFSEDQARAVPPFGGPIYTNRITPPTPCGPGEGVDPSGSIRFNGSARYVYVGSADSANPGVPPNLDLPQGTLYRLDVLASADPLPSGIAYGTTPPGSFQSYPEASAAQPLAVGTQYHLTVLRDVGLPVANCLFTFGDDVAPLPVKDAGPPSTTSDDAGTISDASTATCTLAGGDAQGWGAPCTDSSQCTCAASYCALMPGQTQGYCSKTGCKEDPSVCTSGWSCFDVSQFAPGQPSICIR